MIERQPHMNPWAEKLLQVSMPDGGESWVAMEAILDREMPNRADWRRWVLLILLLLLLIGVCNCPGRGRFFHGGSEIYRDSGVTRTHSPARPAGPSSPKIAAIPDGHTTP